MKKAKAKDAMRLPALPAAILFSTLVGSAGAVSIDKAPTLPLTGARIVNVASESELQAAMADLRDGDAIVLADGLYRLSSSLYINGRDDVTIRGRAGSTNVVLVGKGMDNSNYGAVPFGVWSNGRNTTIAHLTIRDIYDNEIIFNPGAQSPHVYSVRLLDAGSQFIKVNPTDVAAGRGVNDGIIEYCRFEYTARPPGDHGGGVGYFNGISAHAARNWIVRGNVFKNLHNPDNAAYLWNPAVLFWRHSANTVTEANTFVNTDRAVAYGLENNKPYPDHMGGVIRNNFVVLASGLMSSKRTASSDAAIIAWNSPGTQIDHNTCLLNSNVAFAVELRFPATTNGAARNNLSDRPVHLRDEAHARINGNISTATPDMFVDPTADDLHLRSSATNAIDRVPVLPGVTNDFDGDPRPVGEGADAGADEVALSVAPAITHVALTGAHWRVMFNGLPGSSYEVRRANLIFTHECRAIANCPAKTEAVWTACLSRRDGRTRQSHRASSR